MEPAGKALELRKLGGPRNQLGDRSREEGDGGGREQKRKDCARTFVFTFVSVPLRFSLCPHRYVHILVSFRAFVSASLHLPKWCVRTRS